MIKCFKNIILFILILVNCEYYDNYNNYDYIYDNGYFVINRCQIISPYNYKDCIKAFTNYKNKPNEYCCFYKIKTEDICECGCIYLEDYDYRNIVREIDNFEENIVLYCEGNNYKNYFIINMILIFIIFI